MMKVPGALIPNFGKPFSTPVFYPQNFYNKESYIKIVQKQKCELKKKTFRIVDFVNATTIDLFYLDSN